MLDIKEQITLGMNNYIKRVERIKTIYVELLEKARTDESEQKVIMISDKDLFDKIIRNFGGALDKDAAKYDLQTLYDIGIHKQTGALIISNKGATLYSLSERTNTPHLVRHIGFYVYMPGLGIEFANVGLVGDIYNGKVVFRTESACTPSFLFASQRCNCRYQWENIRELSAYFNKTEAPTFDNGEDFEKWVQNQLDYRDGKHNFKQKGDIGFIMLHVDTQNGMGSGYTKDEFTFDLFERASIRHRGEYSAEQIHKETMAGGFKAIGLEPDPRGENNSVGYKISPVILDYLGASKELICLTNNPFKMKQLEDFGYKLTRIKMIGAVNMAGAQEAEQRGTEFNHMDIDGENISFESDVERVKQEINRCNRFSQGKKGKSTYIEYLCRKV
ncbi:MAG TPA: hypothetical protein DEP72_09370 [Clostridiales bacterium]|nr:MAG: hypothetical protein A2Y18_03980 [Clostridiales bacterium GWD2_32_19]HCC08350.1 hypothetical protein [Clostridiales bacterium]